MAKQVIVNQSSREEKIYPLEFSPALLTGVSLLDATLEYTGDNDDDDPPTLDSAIDGTMVYVSVSSLIIGYHRVMCIAQTSNADLSPEIELLITVKT
jgi:hypothetical protein